MYLSHFEIEAFLDSICARLLYSTPSGCFYEATDEHNAGDVYFVDNGAQWGYSDACITAVESKGR